MNSKGPFTGLSFCCTGVSIDRDGLANKIQGMGGVHYNDLMSNVQYLIVGDRNTAKYKFCIRNRADIKFLSQDAITKVYQKWMDGADPSDPTIRIDRMLLPVFEGLYVCVSRVALDIDVKNRLLDHVQFRKDSAMRILQFKSLIKSFFDENELLKCIESHGGDSLESLTLRHSCLVTAQDSGRRYTKAKEWRKPIVHPIWVFDSICRGAAMVFEDYLYDTESLNGQYLNGCNVWVNVLEYGFAEPHMEGGAVPRKKPKPQSMVWNSIMARTALAPRKAIDNSAWDDQYDAQEQEEKEAELNINSRSNFQYIPTLFPHKEIQPGKSDACIFAGVNALCVGFEESQILILEKVISSRQGEVSRDANDETISHIIIPAAQGAHSKQILRFLPFSIKSSIKNGTITVVTEWFIERSIFYRELRYDIWGKPFQGLLHHGGKPWRICITGFTGVELLHVEKLIGYMGHTFCDSLSANRDLLVVNIQVFKKSLIQTTPRLFQYKSNEILDCAILHAGLGQILALLLKNKIKAAKKWQIPVVLLGFLWEALQLSHRLSQKDATLIMPQIADISWCLYAPKRLEQPHSILDHSKSMESIRQYNEIVGSEEYSLVANKYFTVQESETKGYRDLQLPSPRKTKRHQKYGPIIGHSSSESLQTRLMKEIVPSQSVADDAEITNADYLSQVRYDGDSVVDSTV